MKKSGLIIFLCIIFSCNQQQLFTRQLDPRVASFLKMIGNEDQTIEQLRNVWEKCFSGQIHLLFGLPPDAEELKEFAAIVKTAMNECFHK